MQNAQVHLLQNYHAHVGVAIKMSAYISAEFGGKNRYSSQRLGNICDVC